MTLLTVAFQPFIVYRRQERKRVALVKRFPTNNGTGSRLVSWSGTASDDM